MEIREHDRSRFLKTKSQFSNINWHTIVPSQNFSKKCLPSHKRHFHFLSVLTIFNSAGFCFNFSTFHVGKTVFNSPQYF